jgi:hypothetical protein
MHPFIISKIAEDRIAEMHAQAESDRLLRRAARERKDAKRHASRGRVHGHWVSAQLGGWSFPRQAGQPVVQQERELVSVGRAGSDDCV